jgi:hypothetical protein
MAKQIVRNSFSQLRMPALSDRVVVPFNCHPEGGSATEDLASDIFLDRKRMWIEARFFKSS